MHWSLARCARILQTSEGGYDLDLHVILLLRVSIIRSWNKPLSHNGDTEREATAGAHIMFGLSPYGADQKTATLRDRL
jgi:hypothetical protein